MMILSECSSFFRIEFVEDVGVSEKKKYKTKKENKLSGGKFPETLTDWYY
jgi:hypothetical protein